MVDCWAAAAADPKTAPVRWAAYPSSEAFTSRSLTGTPSRMTFILGETWQTFTLHIYVNFRTPDPRHVRAISEAI